MRNCSVRGTSGVVGYDLDAAEATVVPVHMVSAWVKTGLAVALTPWLLW